MANEKSGTSVRDNILAIEQNIAKVMVGCEDVTRLIMTALITGGHVLLEDLPGTGKTTLARTLARSLDVRYQRIQFTPDLLPTDGSSPTFCWRTRSTGRRPEPRRAFWSVWRRNR